jgi:hypothetical protein
MPERVYVSKTVPGPLFFHLPLSEPSVACSNPLENQRISA